MNMGNLQVKIETRTEARNQMMMIDKSLGDIISQLQDLKEERAEIMARFKASKDGQRLKQIGMLIRTRTIAQHETIGMRKLIVRFLERLGVKLPETKLTKLIEKDGEVKALVEAR
jgi:hypothetical protein